MLSIISSIYDPQGLVSPFSIKGKKTLHNLCYVSSRRDNKIPDSCIFCRTSILTDASEQLVILMT